VECGCIVSKDANVTVTFRVEAQGIAQLQSHIRTLKFTLMTQKFRVATLKSTLITLKFRVATLNFTLATLNFQVSTLNFTLRTLKKTLRTPKIRVRRVKICLGKADYSFPSSSVTVRTAV
jgi:hypothetical protein